MRDRKRAELHFEGDESIHGSADQRLHGALSFVRLDGLGDPNDHAEYKGAGTRRWISQSHRRRGQARMLPELRTPQCVIHQPHHVLTTSGDA